MRKYLVTICCVLMLAFFCTGVYAADLDYIQDYNIVVENIRQDGTMDIVYSITWEVLDDKNGKEPVTWVEVGIPNKQVDQIRALTENISKAEYSNSKGGDYVRVDFKDAYYKGDVFKFDFSIHQSYMYKIQNDDSLLYAFRAGWFDEIKIGRLQIEWLKDNRVKSADSNEISGDYFIWSYADLEKGKSVTATVEYYGKTFAVDKEHEYQERSGEISIGIIVIIILVVVAILVVIAILDDGFGGGGGVFISGGGGGGCACACAGCACACACAGGGRAGCSAKGYDSIMIYLDKFNAVVKEILKSNNLITRIMLKLWHKIFKN